MSTDEKEETIGSPPSDEDDDPEREMNSMRDKFRNERQSSPHEDKRDEERGRTRKRDREERKDEFGRIIRDDSVERPTERKPKEREASPSPKQERNSPREVKERAKEDERDKERDNKDRERGREDRDRDVLRDSKERDREGRDRERAPDRDREKERERERELRDSRDRDIRDRDRDRDRDIRDRDRDRDMRDRDRDREVRDRDRDARDREGRDRDRDRDGRDREGRDREGRDRERDMGYGRSHSRERRPLSAPVRDRSPPFKRSRRDDLDTPQEWDRPGAAGDYYRDRNFTPPAYRPGYDRDPYYPPQERTPARGVNQLPVNYPPQRIGGGGGGGVLPPPNNARQQQQQPRPRGADLYEGPLKTYKQFLETQDDHITPQEAEKKYEEYKLKLTAENKKRQARTFFKEHKHEDWFREKYEPTFLEKKKQEKDELCRASAKAFATKLTEGSDIKFTLEAEAHLEEGEQMEDEEEEVVPPVVAEGEETKEPTVEAEEAGEISETTNGSADKEDKEDKEGSEKGEDAEKDKEVSETPKEEGEAESEDKDKKEGPKMISTKPAVQRKNDKLDHALDAQPGQSAASVQAQQQAQQAQQQSQQQAQQQKRGIEPPRDPNTLFIKTVPPSCTRLELTEVLNKITENEPPCKLLLSEPMRMKNFHRIGWVTYSSYDLCAKALKELNGYKFKDFELQMTINKPNNADTLSQRKFKLAPDFAGTEARVAHDFAQANDLMLLLDKERGVEENALLASSEWEVLSTIDKLDRQIYYLRTVHTYCYYCGEQYEDDDDIRRRCGGIHLRGKNKKKDVTDAPPSEKATAWAKELDTKIKDRIAKPDNPDKYTGKTLKEEMVESLMKDNVKRLEEEKYRCVFCSKLFRGDEFVRKHIIAKHAENLTEVQQKAIEEQYFNNYWEDPKHIQPLNNNQQNQRQALHPTPPRVHMQQWEQNQFGRQVTPQGNNRGGNRNAPFQPQVPPPRPIIPLPVPIRVSPVVRRQDNRYVPFPPRRPPIVAPPPPQTGFHDPRGIREYVDLDAPSEAVPTSIDYRTALDTTQ